MEGRGERLMGWRQERWLLWLRWGGEKSKWEERMLTKMRSCHLGSWQRSGLGGAPQQAWLPRVGQLSLFVLGGAPQQARLPRLGQLSPALLGAAT